MTQKEILYFKLPQFLRKGLILCAFIALGAFMAKAQQITPAPDAVPVPPPPVPVCANTVTANVVAFDQIITYNRFGAFDPGGMMFALKRDVVPIIAAQGLVAGNVQLRGNKRPRPIVLRVNEGDCLLVNFTNYLDPNRAHVEQLQFLNQPARRPYYDRTPFFGPIEEQIDGSTRKILPLGTGTVQVKQFNTDGSIRVVDDGTVHLSQGDTPATRTASLHVNGLDYVNGIADDGSNVGKNATSLANPNQVRTYKWYAAKQGQYFLYSTAATIGGEGNGGQIVHGLFGAVNVEPKGSQWYRSQVTNAQLTLVKTGTTAKGQPTINYEATVTAGGDPVLNILKGGEIIYTDLNAIITGFTAANDGCTDASGARIDPPSSTCGQPFREFTVLFHDELESGAPAFPELVTDVSVFGSIKDGFGVNYGSAGVGAEVLANRKKVGPGANCQECEFEEFFLESWVNGDPAMLVKVDPVTKKANQVLFPDDPSNVHHSYIGDPVRFRNVHAGPKETHIFHLHAHQWLQSPRDQNSTYLDSQTISPGGSYTYEINYGGSGNHNLLPGDSIFHCHLYPHFAQGMWELWRSHDVFEDGSAGRNLPDGEIAAGTPNPAIIPIKDLAMPLMPTAAFKGFPFYIAAIAGHRPSQPPLGLEQDGGLRRHYIPFAIPTDGVAAIPPNRLNDPIHQRVAARNPDPNLRAFARDLEQAQVTLLPPGGTGAELTAMSFHDGTLFPSVSVTTAYDWLAKAYDSFTSSGAAKKFLVNGRAKVAGAPYADPCPATYQPDIELGARRNVPLRKYRAAWIQFDPEDNGPNGFKTLTINDSGWHDRQGRITVLENDALDMLHGVLKPEPLFFRANSGDCIDYRVTNLMQKDLNLDDFQVYQGTDIVGQHIHLVKFDVTSSDGAGNGWNYESGALAAEAVRETISAMRKFNGCVGEFSGDPRDNTDTCPVPKAHPKFGNGPNGIWTGAQTLIERWWADPLMNRATHDRTMRTVFTHDHFSPSGHQHHGLYAGLVIEPTDSIWTNLTGTVTFGSRVSDGGPTSFAANILAGPAQSRSYREFMLEIGDFAIVYTPELQPVNPPNRVEHDPPFIVGSIIIDDPSQKPFPEAISSADPGTSVINYRHEPIPLRIGQLSGGTFQQKLGQAGDLAYAFSSAVHGDPFTPILPAYPGDHIQVRVLQGAQEEQHVMNIHAHRWFFEPGTPHDPGAINNSGFTNSQAIGISEHFEFDFNDKVAPVFNDIGTADFLYQSAAVDNLWDGMWGLMRTYQYFHPDIINILPSNPLIPPPPPVAGATSVATGLSAPTTPFATAEAITKPRASGASIATPDAVATSSPDTPDPLTKDGTLSPDDVKSNDPNKPSNPFLAATGGINTCPTTIPGLPIINVVLEAWLAKDLLAALPNGVKGIVYNSKFDFFDPAGIVYINAADRAAIAAGTKPLEPLVLRINAGDCVNVLLRNRLPVGAPVPEYTSFNEIPAIVPKFNFNQVKTSNRLSLHAQVVAFDVSGSDGAAIGFNPDTTVGPGQSINYAWYAGKMDVDNAGTIILTPAEFGVTNLRDYGDVIKHASHGAIGSMVVEPKGAQYFAVGSTTTQITSGAKADIRGSGISGLLFREFVVHYQDDVTMQSGTSGGIGMKNFGGVDDPEESGQTAFNYRNEPLWARFGLPPETPITGGPDVPVGATTLNDLIYTNSLSSNTASFNCGVTPCDPRTPIFEAKPGTNVRFRITQAAGHPRQHGFTLFGHHWNFEPWQNASLVQGTNPLTFEIGSYGGFGPTRHFNILTVAGGLTRKTGDFLYRTQDSFNFAGGLWGIFRVSTTAP